MSLSKVYPTLDTFEPEDLVSSSAPDSSLFEPSSARVLPETEIRKVDHPPADPQPDQNPHATLQAPAEQETGNHPSPDPQEPEPEHPPEPQSAPQNPPRQSQSEPPLPPVQGIPAEEVDRIVAESFEKGVQQGLQQAQDDFGSAARALLFSCQQLDSLRETILQNSVNEIKELVVAIAEKVIRHSVSEQQDTIFATVDEAIQKAVKSDEFYVLVNPADYDTISTRSAELVAGLSGLNNLVIKKDPSIEQGGCRLESENCIVDATLLGQLDIIANHLKN